LTNIILHTKDFDTLDGLSIVSGIKFGEDSWRVQTKNGKTLLFGAKLLNLILTKGQVGWLFSYAYEDSEMRAILNIKSVGLIFGEPPKIENFKKWFNWSLKRGLIDFL